MAQGLLGHLGRPPSACSPPRSACASRVSTDSPSFGTGAVNSPVPGTLWQMVPSHLKRSSGGLWQSLAQCPGLLHCKQEDFS